MHKFAELVSVLEPLGNGVIVFMDGFSFISECRSEFSARHVFTANMVVIRWWTIPGVWLQWKSVLLWSKLSRKRGGRSSKCMLFTHIHKRIGHLKDCDEQGFPSNGSAWKVFLGLVNQCTTWCLPPQTREYLLQLSNVYTSLWQSSKWGMQGLECSFPHC